MYLVLLHFNTISCCIAVVFTNCPRQWQLSIQLVVASAETQSNLSTTQTHSAQNQTELKLKQINEANKQTKYKETQLNLKLRQTAKQSKRCWGKPSLRKYHNALDIFRIGGGLIPYHSFCMCFPQTLKFKYNWFNDKAANFSWKEPI